MVWFFYSRWGRIPGGGLKEDDVESVKEDMKEYLFLVGSDVRINNVAFGGGTGEKTVSSISLFADNALFCCCRSQVASVSTSPPLFRRFVASNTSTFAPQLTNAPRYALGRRQEKAAVHHLSSSISYYVPSTNGVIWVNI